MNNPQNSSGVWRKQKSKLKIMFSTLNDNDFKYEYGMKDVMMTNLQQKLGKSRSELNELFAECGLKRSEIKYFKKIAIFS
jgi:hypothetical protein